MRLVASSLPIGCFFWLPSDVIKCIETNEAIKQNPRYRTAVQGGQKIKIKTTFCPPGLDWQRGRLKAEG